MSYTSVFGGTTIYPSDVSLLALTLDSNKALDWPLESNDPANPAARIIDVTTTGLYELTLPDATQTGAGQTILFNNLSASSNNFTLKDAGGGTLATIAVGEQWQVYLSGTSTPAGVWRVFRYGASTATVQASALAGYGVAVTGSTLSQSIPVTTFNSGPRTVLLTDRASALVWNGTGAGTLNLPSSASAGNNFFISARNSGGGDLVVDAAGSEQIDGGASVTLHPGDSTSIMTNGLEWYTLGLGQEAVFAFDYTSVPVTGGNYTLAGSELNRIAYKFVGVLTADQYIIVPATVQQYWVDNATTGPFNLYLRTAAGTPVLVVQGGRGIYYCNGTNIVIADTSSLSIPILATDGGTGQTSYTAGDLLYANTPSTLAKLSSVALGNALLSGGVGGFPTWGQVGLGTHVDGILPVANGGTGADNNLDAANNLGLGPSDVVYTSGNQTIFGTKTFNSALFFPDGGFVFANDAGQNTGIIRVSEGVMALRADGQNAVTVAATAVSTGNNVLVGIGTTAQANKLEVVGGALTPANAATYAFGVANSGGANRDLVFGSDATNTYIQSFATKTLNLNLQGNNIVTGGGSVGIGITPTQKLHVNGNVLAAQFFTPAGAGISFNGATASSGVSSDATGQQVNILAGGAVRLNINAFGGVTSTDLADAVGYKGLPQATSGLSFTFDLTHLGKHILLTGGASTCTIPPNASVAFQKGSVIDLVNDGSAGKTLAQGAGVTLKLAGTGATGNRTLAVGAVATLLKVDTDVWYVSGAGVS